MNRQTKMKRIRQSQKRKDIAAPKQNDECKSRMPNAEAGL
jgi:hypothetical protein